MSAGKKWWFSNPPLFSSRTFPKYNFSNYWGPIRGPKMKGSRSTTKFNDTWKWHDRYSPASSQCNWWVSHCLMLDDTTNKWLHVDGVLEESTKPNLIKYYNWLSIGHNIKRFHGHMKRLHGCWYPLLLSLLYLIQYDFSCLWRILFCCFFATFQLLEKLACRNKI